MISEQENWVNVECEYTSSQRFTGEIYPKCKMAYWQCSGCGFTYVAEDPSDVCPEYGKICDLNNITNTISNWDII